MKLFAALEKALLARWKKVKYALKVERWPLLNIKEQRLQLKKQYLESLFKKKWSIYTQVSLNKSIKRLKHRYRILISLF